MAWVEENFDGSYDTAKNYMTLAKEAKRENSPFSPQTTINQGLKGTSRYKPSKQPVERKPMFEGAPAHDWWTTQGS